MKVKLAYYISELRRDFVKECSRKLQEDDLTPGLLYPVLYIGRHPGCSPKELTEALHMDWGRQSSDQQGEKSPGPPPF